MPKGLLAFTLTQTDPGHNEERLGAGVEDTISCQISYLKKL